MTHLKYKETIVWDQFFWKPHRKHLVKFILLVIISVVQKQEKNPYFIFKKMGIKVLSTAEEVLFAW